MVSHNEKTCNVCQIIKEEKEMIKQIQKINEERRKKGLELLDDGSNIPSHCGWCYSKVVWSGDHWCSEKCYNVWKYWYDILKYNQCSEAE